MAKQLAAIAKQVAEREEIETKLEEARKTAAAAVLAENTARRAAEEERRSHETAHLAQLNLLTEAVQSYPCMPCMK